LELRKPIATTDAKSVYTRGSMSVGRARDAILSPPTQTEYAENARRVASTIGMDLGQVWAGDLKPVSDAIARVKDALSRIKDKGRIGDALAAAVSELADYGGQLKSREAELGAAGSLTFGGGGPERSAASVGDSGGAQLRARRDKTANEVKSINKANSKFWDRKPAV
jgi:hypothetical protein